MEQFSASDAITAGFRLIRREPLAFLAWAAVYGVVGLTPQFVGFATGIDAAASIAGGASPEALAQQLAPLQRLQPLSILGSLAASLFLYSAIYRAILFPDERRFLYLQLDSRSLWMALSALALGVLYIIAVIAMIIPLALLIGIGALLAGNGAGASIATGLGTGLIILAVFGVIVWGGVRMSVLLPMGFAKRRFMIPEAWRLTKGHALRIFGVFLALFVILVLAELLLFGIGAGVVSMFIPLGDIGRMMTTNPMALFKQVNPVVLTLVAIVWSLFGAAAAAAFSGAIAEIYSGLARRDGVADVFA